MWYHLSRTKWRNEFIDSIPSVNPNRSHGERRPPATSVAPTVCQCYIAASDSKERVDCFYIYEVFVHSPEPVTEAHWVMDHLDIQEHLITKEVLESEGGKIPVSPLGWVRYDDELLRCMKYAITQQKLRPTAEDEKELLWSTRGDEWVPLFEGREGIKKCLSV
jgi:hypothetical protein